MSSDSIWGNRRAAFKGAGRSGGFSGCFRHADGARIGSDLAAVARDPEVITAINHGLVIQFQKLGNLAGMVEMAVGEYQCVGLFQVDAEALRVFQHAAGMAGIEQDMAAFRLDPCREPVFFRQVFVKRFGIDQYCDFD